MGCKFSCLPNHQGTGKCLGIELKPRYFTFPVPCQKDSNYGLSLQLFADLLKCSKQKKLGLPVHSLGI